VLRNDDKATFPGQHRGIFQINIFHFPEDLQPGCRYYDITGSHCQDINKAAKMIYLKNQKLQAKKMGQKSDFKTLPHAGWKEVQISSRFLADLKVLADLPRKMKEVEGWLKGG
jgi:hypothetical protein